MFDQIEDARRALQKRWSGKPRIGIILGTGLGGLVEEIQAEQVFDYKDIPHFPVPTVHSHAGRLVCGKLSGKTVMAMEGRFHFYEGYSLKQITFPVRVMKAMGCEVLIVSNACGGMNPQWAKGDLMVIEDHINLMNDNPLLGPNDDRLGIRFPDMSRPYDAKLITLAQKIALEEKVVCQKGVFVAVPGPNLETRAEYRFLRTIGADVVGMSTVPEVIVGVHAGMRIVGFSIITDMCLPDALEPATLEEIISVANTAEKAARDRASARWGVAVKREVAALLFALVFPSVMTWIYFVGASGGGTEQNSAVLWAYGVGKVIQFAFPLVYVLLIAREFFRPTWPTQRGIAFGLAFGLTVGGAMLALYFGVLRDTKYLSDVPDKVLAKLRETKLDSVMGYVAMASFYSIFHSLLEEYYWRWFVFGRLRRLIKLWPAVTIASLGFMAHHVIVLAVYFPGIRQFFTLALPLSLCVAIGGAVWCWIYQRSGSLYAPWISHALIDAAIFAIGFDMVASQLMET